MKIIVLQDRLRSGGTERQSILLANAFAAAGHAVTLLTFRPGGALDATVATAVKLRALQPFDSGFDWWTPGLLRALQYQRADVVLCMGRMANCYAGRIQLNLPSTTVVATMRTGKPLPGPFQRSLQTVRHVVANSRDAADRLVAEHGVAREKIAVIHNSLVFPSESALTRNEELRVRLGATPATVVLLCVAMFRPEKNQRQLIEFAAQLPTTPPWQLWLAGDGPARAACEELATERGVADRVRFLGFHPDPAPFYRAADIAVHASQSESLSNFLIEAQAHGLPAVVCAAQGIGECFLPGQTGWVVPQGDGDAFRARLRPLMQNADLRRACAAPARAFARAGFETRQQVQAYLDLFAQLVPAPATP